MWKGKIAEDIVQIIIIHIYDTEVYCVRLADTHTNIS